MKKIFAGDFLADPDDPAEAALRLEKALERIATLANRPVVVASGDLNEVPSAPGALSGGDIGEIANRLDALIAQLRSALSA